MADNIFCTRLSGKMISLHFLLDQDPNNAFYTNAKNVLYTLVESVIYFTLVAIMDFLLVKLRVVLSTNYFSISYIFH